MTPGFKEVYLVATDAPEPIAPEVLTEALAGEEVELIFDEPGVLFSVRSENTRVDVRFETRLAPLGWTPELLTGAPELKDQLKYARGFYFVGFTPGQPQPSVAAFEALWCVRMLLELCDGVAVDTTAFKLHSQVDVEEITELDFDIRDHLTVHAQAIGDEPPQFWVHTHGMAKFAALDVEMFRINEDDLSAAETFFYELTADLAFGNGPAPRQLLTTSVGKDFQLLPAEEGRTSLLQAGVDAETFVGHSTGFLTVTSPEGRHLMSDILQHYRERFTRESDEEAEQKQDDAARLLPMFKGRYLRKGLMEPLTFLVRAPFEVHPDGAHHEADQEQLWVEVVQWADDSLIGRLVEGGTMTSEWRKGSHVEVDDAQINALAVAREGRQLEPDEMEQLLKLERPA